MPLQVLHTVAELREALDRARRGGARIGFVPTMGALHQGHLALVQRARKAADLVVVSIFVNPTQFGPSEDFARYPRTLDADVARCEAQGVGVVFAPEVREMYPDGDDTRVRVGRLGEPMCGPYRPGHFEGVATVVAKLFAVVGPCTAVLGKKDYQQWRVVERMTTDLRLPVTVVGAPTVRDPDGLAMSSRNAYLGPEERARALSIPRALAAAQRAFAKGERRASSLLALAHEHVDPAATSIDYVTLADPVTLEPHEEASVLAGPALLALALRMGTTRLIDNTVLGQDEAPGGV
jgi:pantoate--beta-alanine ligase